MIKTFLQTSAISAAALSASWAAEEEAGLPQLQASTYPSQILWLLITFATLYFVMSKVFLPRIGGIIEERRNRIADDYDQAAEFKREAEAAEEAYRTSLADAKAQAARIAAETRAAVDADIAELQHETDAQLDAEISAAEGRIAETATRAATTVREAAADTTKALVSALIDETPSDDAVDAALGRAGA